MVSLILDTTMLIVIVLIFFGMLLGLFYFMTYWMDMRQKCPELDVFLAARKRPFPLLTGLVDLSGRILFFKGIKERPQDPKLKKDDYGLLLDPRLASKMPKSSLEDGTPILLYGSNFHFPIAPNGARAIIQLVKKIRSEYPQFNFIRDDTVLLELLTKSGEDLPKDVETVISMFPLETEVEGTNNVRPNQTDIVRTIEEIKGKLKAWRVEPGYFSMKEGLELLPIGTTSTDMKRVETITKINTINDMQKAQEDYMKYIYVIGGLATVMVVTYMVISAYKGG